MKKSIVTFVSLLLSLPACVSYATDLVFSETKIITVDNAKKYGLLISTKNRLNQYFVTVEHKKTQTCSYADLELVVFDRANSAAFISIPIKSTKNLFEFSIAGKYLNLSGLDIRCVASDGSYNNYILNLNVLGTAVSL